MSGTLKIDPARDALVVVDVQNDFCPGGALAVNEGDAVVEPLNRALAQSWALTAATRDWHPVDHGSFVDQGGTWPPHCVQGQPGANFHDALVMSHVQHVVEKGHDADDPGYSGVAGTDLADLLRDAGAERVFVGGLATDYCVKATVLDLAREGFDVVLLRDAVRAVDVQPGDGDSAIAEMRSAGATIASSEDFA